MGVGHVLNYRPDAAAIERGLAAIVLSFAKPRRSRSTCATWSGRARGPRPPRGWVGEDWALVTEFSVPAPDRFVRQMARFIRERDGSWRRGDERHDNVLIETDRVPGLLARVGVEAAVRVVVRDGGAACGAPRRRRPPARLTRPGRAYRSAILASICWVTARPAAEARETVAETLVGLADRQVEGTTIDDRRRENSPAAYFAPPDACSSADLIAPVMIEPMP